MSAYRTSGSVDGIGIEQRHPHGRIGLAMPPDSLSTPCATTLVLNSQQLGSKVYSVTRKEAVAARLNVENFSAQPRHSSGGRRRARAELVRWFPPSCQS